MNFRTNQVLQFFVNNEINTIALVDNGKSFHFINTQGGKVVSRTDIIEKDKISFCKLTEAEEMQIPLKQYTVAINEAYFTDGKPQAGQDYIVKINFSNYQGFADDNMGFKVGSAHATSKSTKDSIVREIAKSLYLNMLSEYSPLVNIYIGDTLVNDELLRSEDFATTTGNLVIKEVRQNDWVLGVTPDEGVNFNVTVASINVDGESTFDWATITEGTTGEFITNGRKMADMEYFAMGERGDQYKMGGYPNVIRVKYLIGEAGAEKSYDAITIHYAFIGANEGVQKSERDLMIVGEDLATLYAKIEEAINKQE